MLVSSTATEVIRENEKRSQVLLFECALPGFRMHAAGRDEQPDRQSAGRAPADWRLGQQDGRFGGSAERNLRLPCQRQGRLLRNLPLGGAHGQRRDSRYAISHASRARPHSLERCLDKSDNHYGRWRCIFQEVELGYSWAAGIRTPTPGTKTCPYSVTSGLRSSSLYEESFRRWYRPVG